MDNGLAYDKDLARYYEHMPKEHAIVLDWIKEKKEVLEFGCHTGYFSSAMQKKGCSVTGVELFEPALEKAEPYLEKAILGNVEDPEVWKQIGEKKYDAVLFMHVLEHLVDPDRVLRNTHHVLKDDGLLIICLPNINNWVDRWDIFRGKFNYTETGVMDRTHLKFYNVKTARDFIERNGFKVNAYSGESMRVRFKVVPDIRVIWRINNVYSKVLYKLFSPNLTDKIVMYKANRRKS